MIDFSEVEKPNFWYDAIYTYTRLVYKYIYWRRFQVEGRENIPQDNGAIVICNHQNGLMDALAVLYSTHDRKPVFLARADIFKKDAIAKLLRFIRIMPAYRMRDTGVEGLGNNQAIFDHSARIVNNGGFVALFPEAGHRGGHFLGQFKKGFARMAFRAAETDGFSKDITILPVGHHYSHYFSMQGDLLVSFGKPFGISELYEDYKEHPERALHTLAEKARGEVQQLMLDIADTENYEEINLLCNMYVPRYKEARGLSARSLSDSLAAQQDVNRKVAGLKESSPESFASLMEKAATYRSNLDNLKLRDWIMARTHALGFVTRTLLWAVLLPLFVVSSVLNIVPYLISYSFGRKTDDPMLKTSFVFAVGTLVVFPIWYLMMFALCWIFTKTFWMALLLLALLPATLVVFQRVLRLDIKLVNRVRKMWFKLTRNKKYRDTARLRRDIISSLDALFA